MRSASTEGMMQTIAAARLRVSDEIWMARQTWRRIGGLRAVVTFSALAIYGAFFAAIITSSVLTP